jgi:hypothetical protein
MINAAHLASGRCALTALLICATCGTLPLRAETPEELDSLAGPTSEARAGMSLARAQAARGELLEALASVERVLARHPEALEAQLLHASLRCRVDDVPGAQAEFARLDRKQFRSAAWAEANAPCVARRGS